MSSHLIIHAQLLNVYSKLEGHYLYMPPLHIDTLHDCGGMGWGCLSHLHLSYCTHLFLHLLAPINTWQLISSFSQLHGVIHASSCAQLFMRTAHSLALPLPLSSLCFSAACLSLSFSHVNHECEMTQRHVWATICEEIVFLSPQYIHFYFLMLFLFCFIHLNISYYASVS